MRAVLAAPVLMLAQRRQRQVEFAQQTGGELHAVGLRPAVELFVLSCAAAAADFNADAGAVAFPLPVSGMPAVHVERQNLDRLALVDGEMIRDIAVVPAVVQIGSFIDRGPDVPGVVNRDIFDLRHRVAVFVLQVVTVLFQQVFADLEPLVKGDLPPFQHPAAAKREQTITIDECWSTGFSIPSSFVLNTFFNVS